MTIKTRAAVAYKAKSPMVIEDVVLDPPGDGDVLVEVKASGLCHTDLGMLSGESPLGALFPVLLGHEGSDVVLEVGREVTDLGPGDHVIVFAPECQNCGACHSHKGNFCEAAFSGYGSQPSITAGRSRILAGYGVGTFANHLVTTESRPVKDAPIDEISYLSCRATTGIGDVLFEAKVERNSSVVVFGLAALV